MNEKVSIKKDLIRKCTNLHEIQVCDAVFVNTNAGKSCLCTYQNFDESILQFVSIRHWGLCTVPRRRLANMVAFCGPDRPVQHRLLPRSNQTHFTLKMHTTKHVSIVSGHFYHSKQHLSLSMGSQSHYRIECSYWNRQQTNKMQSHVVKAKHVARVLRPYIHTKINENACRQQA